MAPVIRMDPLYVQGAVSPTEVRVVSKPGVPTWFLYAAGAFGTVAFGLVALSALRTRRARGRRGRR